MRKNLKRTTVLFISAFLFLTDLNAQYITLPDPAFADFIAVTYPTAVNASKQLDTNAAKTITGTFNCKWKNINNAFGLQYFESVDKIHLTGNNLTTIPSLQKITNLTVLDLDSNQITTLPALNTFVNLATFKCRSNQLTSIPSLAGLSNLVQLFIDNNKLISLPNLTGLISLDHFICSDNLITSLPDMSTLTSLRRFLATNNKLTNVDLTNIPNVKEVHLIYNRLTEFPNISGMVQLTELEINLNQIDSVPDLSTFINLAIFKIHQNKLTFEDLVPLTSHPNFNLFQVSPQQLVGQQDTLEFKEGDSLIWDTQIDNTITTNTYSWYKDNVLISTSASNIFSIDSLLLKDNGIYTFEIRNSNPALAGIVLSSYALKLIVKSCLNASQIEIELLDNNCKFPIQGNVNESTIYGGSAPYTYTLKNFINGEEIIFTSANLNIPQEGIYDLVIKDNQGCTVSLQKKVIVPRNPECEPIIYPESSGPESSYYIENTGNAIIYNKEGAVVRELTLPAYWDGTNQQGILVDSGLYVIIINEQIKIPLSVMRRN